MVYIFLYRRRVPNEESGSQIDADNFQTHYLRFRDRQAGISLIYEASQNSYRYNVYCLETKLLKEIFS